MYDNLSCSAQMLSIYLHYTLSCFIMIDMPQVTKMCLPKETDGIDKMPFGLYDKGIADVPERSSIYILGLLAMTMPTMPMMIRMTPMAIATGPRVGW
jgi:hypothetical protein